MRVQTASETQHITIETSPKVIQHRHTPLGGVDPAGNRIDITSYYLTLNDVPFFAISGEFHFSRYNENHWEKELVKMKMGGINIVTTYIFWNHHEEVESSFDWSGNKNLRGFIEICGKLDLWVIIRIGPFAHGEARNGGLPDWLYGRPFDIRSNDEGYLVHVNRWYSAIAGQVAGALFKDGGPVVATQIENEFQHSAAPWEMTTGINNEWTPGGKGGDDHMRTLLRIAKDAGILTPIYTCTAWGGASTPTPDMLPLWGGYSFQPWLFYGDVKEHPATPEYIFRDFHNNAIPKTYNFEPRYKPEDMPYACCEMGGGMTVFYRYRFRLPPESVEAMAHIKLAGGCNMLGYYMYHGGTNPYGKLTPFLNEHAVPKLSYDYQAAIGEFGVPRKHFHGLRIIHYFLRSFGEQFCLTRTFLPPGAESIQPADRESVRYAVRASGRSGYLFINNYQDHNEMVDRKGMAFHLAFADGSGDTGPRKAPVSGLTGSLLRIPFDGGMGLSADASCVLPFNLGMESLTLIYASAQLVSRIVIEGVPHWVFCSPLGMTPEFCFTDKAGMEIHVSNGTQRKVRGNGMYQDDNLRIVSISGGKTSSIDISIDGVELLRALVLTTGDSYGMWLVSALGSPRLIVTDGTVLDKNNGNISIEWYGKAPPAIKTYPPLANPPALGKRLPVSIDADDFLARYVFESEENGAGSVHTTGDQGLRTQSIRHTAMNQGEAQHVCDVRRIGSRKAVLRFLPDAPAGYQDILIRIDYRGDIGNAYSRGRLIHDNFANGDPWIFSYSHLPAGAADDDIYIDVVPLKKGNRVLNDTTMAGRMELSDEEIGEIVSIEFIPVHCEPFSLF